MERTHELRRDSLLQLKISLQRTWKRRIIVSTVIIAVGSICYGGWKYQEYREHIKCGIEARAFGNPGMIVDFDPSDRLGDHVTNKPYVVRMKDRQGRYVTAEVYTRIKPRIGDIWEVRLIDCHQDKHGRCRLTLERQYRTYPWEEKMENTPPVTLANQP